MTNSKKTPAIASRRREEAIKKFSFKLSKLEELLALKDFDRLPKRMQRATFIAWDDEQIGVKKLSRNLLYETVDEYTVLHRKMDKLLADLSQARSKGTKRFEKSTKLQDKLEAAERRAQIYINDYSIVKAELEDKIAENAYLKQHIARLQEQNRTRTALQVVQHIPKSEK